MASRGAAPCALGLGASLGAAAPALPLPEKDRAEITALLGPGVVGKALPSEPISDARPGRVS